MSTSQQRTTHSDRISALEEGYKSLGREIGGLRQDFLGFADEVRRQMQHGARTQWAPLIGAIALAVTIVTGLITLGAAGPLQDIERHELRLERLADNAAMVQGNRFTDQDGQRLRQELTQAMERVRASLEEHASDGHPHRVDAKVGTLSDRLNRLESWMHEMFRGVPPGGGR